jgi:hypothetical protein
VTRYIPGGLTTANFGFAVLFAPESEAPGGFLVDTYRDYVTTADMVTDGFLVTDETYIAADKWLGASPSTRQLRVWMKADLDLSYVDTFAKAREEFWWFITLCTIELYDDAADVVLAAGWHNTNETYFPSPTNEVAVLTPGDATSMPYQLTALGYRYTHSTYHPTDRYAAFPILAWFASVNYSVPNSTLTGEYKTVINVTPFNGTQTEYNAMEEDDTKCGFVTDVELQGSQVNNRYINALTHSAQFERIDDVFSTAAFVNEIKVSIFNTIANQATKLGQTMAGQQAVITASQKVCELYVENGFLGERNYLNPDTGFEEYTIGYQIITVPEDILDLTESERTQRESAPMVIRIFRAGAIEHAFVDLTIY